MRAVIADTGPLYALRDPDDQHYERAQEQGRRLERDRVSVVVPWTTLLESHSLILRRLTLTDARQWLDEVRQGADLLDPTPEDYERACERVLRFTDQSITLFDAVIAVTSERLDLPIWTSDHHFDVMEANVWR